MAKVLPQKPMIVVMSSSDSCYTSSERKTFTLWMKSLVIHSNGCTVFNSRGEVVFRVDNYQTRRCREVFLMNFTGQVIFSIKRKKVSIFGIVQGYKWTTQKDVEHWFKLRRNCSFFGRDTTCSVDFPENCLKIVELGGKSTFKIIDHVGQILAEVMPKQSSGVCLGNDVLTLTVESEIDQSLIMALVLAHGMLSERNFEEVQGQYKREYQILPALTSIVKKKLEAAGFGLE